MALRVPFPTRVPRNLPFGSVTLARNQRIGPGSVVTTDDVDTSFMETKTFMVRGNLRGSYTLQASLMGTDQYFNINSGTWPRGPGSAKTISTQEAFRRMRLLISPLPSGSVGSASAFFAGGFIRPR